MRIPESTLMMEAILIPAGTVITEKGDSPAIDIATAESCVFLLDMKITEGVEQQSFDCWLLGSTDGTNWAPKPLATLPQYFYVGEYPTLLDLSADTQTKFLRLHWEVSRWGRGELKPRFNCGMTLREVAPALLIEARAEAQARR
jgi:hypothetical protein